MSVSDEEFLQWVHRIVEVSSMSVYKVRNQHCIDGEHEKCPHVGITGYRCECECHGKRPDAAKAPQTSTKRS